MQFSMPTGAIAMRVELGVLRKQAVEQFFGPPQTLAGQNHRLALPADFPISPLACCASSSPVRIIDLALPADPGSISVMKGQPQKR